MYVNQYDMINITNSLIFLSARCVYLWWDNCFNSILVCNTSNGECSIL